MDEMNKTENEMSNDEEQVKNMIDFALNLGVDDTEEDFQRKQAEADRATEAHGIKGENVPVDTDTRYKRMAMNFYGMMLNFMHLFNSHLVTIERQNAEILNLLGAPELEPKAED